MRRHSREEILAEYKQMYRITFPADVIRTSFAFDELTAEACTTCGTWRFAPNVAGDGAFYEVLSRHLPWYYKANRWEFPIAADILAREKTTRFLDVGCGDGHFIDLARARGLEGHGCEVNPRSLDVLQARGIPATATLHDGLGRYDVVVMFQVLEHLVDPCSVLQSLLGHVRDGGLLMFSTPVRPSCLSFAMPVLAMPPHHQWLPTVDGFRALAARLDLACERIVCDPPDPSQVAYALQKRFGSFPYLGRVSRWTWKTARMLDAAWAAVGHTGLAVLRKREAGRS